MVPVAEAVSIKEIEKESNQICITARDMVITNNEQHVSASEYLKTIKGMQDEVSSAFDPIVRKAHEAHKEAVAQKNRYLEPLQLAEKFLKDRIRKFLDEQERKRLEAERVAREAAAKEAEKLKKKAAKADAVGDIEKAEQLLQQAETVRAITPVVSSTVSKVNGVESRKDWKFRVVDATKIPREYLMVDLVAIGAMVRAKKGQVEIPGVEIYSETNISARRT